MRGHRRPASLAIGDAAFWIATPGSAGPRLHPRAIGGATSRILLVTDDPDAVFGQAVTAGAIPTAPPGKRARLAPGPDHRPARPPLGSRPPLNAWPPLDRDLGRLGKPGQPSRTRADRPARRHHRRRRPNEVTEHIGGSGSAVAPSVVTFRDRAGRLRAVVDGRQWAVSGVWLYLVTITPGSGPRPGGFHDPGALSAISAPAAPGSWNAARNCHKMWARS